MSKQLAPTLRPKMRWMSPAHGIWVPKCDAHHLSRKLNSLGHNARLMSAKYVRPYSKGQKNDFHDAEVIAEALQRPTMTFVATKTADQLDLQALHRVRERLVSQRTGIIINQVRAFLLERGIAVRQGQRFLRAELPRILATPLDVLSPRIVRLAGDWRRLDERVEALSNEIEAIARQDAGCERLMSVPGIGPIISSAMVAAIGGGDAFQQNFLGLLRILECRQLHQGPARRRTCIGARPYHRRKARDSALVSENCRISATAATVRSESRRYETAISALTLSTI